MTTLEAPVKRAGSSAQTKSTIVLRTPSGKERTLPALPLSWKWVHVGDITEVVRGASPRPKGDPRYFGGAVPWIMISDVTRAPGKYLYETKQGVTDAGAELSRKLAAGSLILSNSGTVCVPKILRVDGCIHDGFLAFPTLADTVDLNFAYYWFEAVRPVMINENRQGVTQVNLNTGIVREMHFPLPPRDEQQRIVAEIEKQFTRLEAGVASLKRVRAALKRYRASVLKAACEGRLVPTEAELARRESRSYQSGRELLSFILADRLAQWAGRGNLEHLFELEAPASPLPKGWTWAKVDQLASPEPNSITDGPFGSNLKTEHYTASGPRVIRLQNIGEGVYVDEAAHIAQSHFERLQKHRVLAGDVVIAAFGASPPRSCIIPETLGPAIVKADCIRLNPHRLLVAGYINAALNSEPVRKRTIGMVHGVGRPRLNLGEIKSIVIPLPPLAEQHRIVAEVERRLSIIEELQFVVATNLQRATRLHQSILRKAFRQ